MDRHLKVAQEWFPHDFIPYRLGRDCDRSRGPRSSRTVHRDVNAGLGFPARYLASSCASRNCLTSSRRVAPRYGRRKIMKPSGAGAECHDGPSIPDGERRFSRCAELTRQRDERRARQHVDVIPRKIVETLRTAQRQMRPNRELDELVRIAGFRRRPLGLALAGKDADADALIAPSTDERAAHGGHDAAATAGQKIHAEVG